MNRADQHIAYRSMGEVSLNERLGAGFMMKRHSRDVTARHYSLVYVLHGSGSYHDDQGDRLLRAGDIFQRIPDWEHTTLTDDDWQECFIALPRSLALALLRLHTLPQNPNIVAIGIQKALVERFSNLVLSLNQATESQLPLVLGNTLMLLTDTLALSHRTASENTKMVELACQALSADSDQRFNLPRFCREQSWGYERFRKVFQEHMGISPGHYRIRRRLDHACQLLHYHDLNIKQVAQSLGYPSPYEFSAQFKKHMGISPKEYRKQGRVAGRP
jgi:AraC-like DNA-binding protein